MTILTTIILLVLSLFGGLVLNNTNTTQQRADDTMIRSDINAVFQKLEEHYNENGDYPTLKQLTERGADVLPGINPEALIDKYGVALWEQDSLYTYEPSDCGAIGCSSYTISSTLSSGEQYEKYSLN